MTENDRLLEIATFFLHIYRIKQFIQMQTEKRKNPIQFLLK